jgi:hypothetical protein
MEKLTPGLKKCVLLAACLVFFSFVHSDLLNEQAIFMQKKLLDHYDSQQEAEGMKKTELKVTRSGFCRYKRFFTDGKIEYFSFNMVKFRDLSYLGTIKRGKLLLYTRNDDVIVQTYNKKAGDLDSMATCLVIPLKNIEPEDLVEFAKGFRLMHAALTK